MRAWRKRQTVATNPSADPFAGGLRGRERPFNAASEALSRVGLGRAIVVSALVVQGLSWWSYWAASRLTRDALAGELVGELEETVEELSFSLHHARADAETIAQTEPTRAAIEQLVALARERGATAVVLGTTPLVETLHRTLFSLPSAGHFESFAVADLEGAILAASFEKFVGTRFSLAGSEGFRRAVAGEPVVLAASSGEPGAVPTGCCAGVFVMVPVHGSGGETIGILILEIHRNSILVGEKSRGMRVGGQVYALNEKGEIVSSPASLDLLLGSGVVEAKAGRVGPVVRAADPGGDIRRGFVPHGPAKSWPLTRVARAISRKETGVDVEGHRDFLGREVVGAWRWIPELDLGVAVESEVKRAFRLVFAVRNLATWSFFASVLAVVGLLLLVKRQSALYRQNEAALEEWQQAIDSIEVPLVVFDRRGVVHKVNTTAAARSNAGAVRECLGRNVNDLGPKEPWKMAQEAVKAFADGRPMPTPGRREDRGAGEVWDLRIGFASPRSGGMDAPILVGGAEMTRFVALEQELAETKKVSEMGALLGAVAHDVRNPLFAITAAVDAFEARMGGRRELTRYLQVLREESGKLSNLMNELLLYGKGKKELALSSAEEALGRAVRSCAEQGDRAGVQVVVRVAEGLPRVLINSDRLTQAYQNAIQNAIQFSPRDSKVEVSLGWKSHSAEREVACVVSDEGPGFEAQDLKRAFSPFYSARPNGVGLGLFIAQKIIQENRGCITLSNRPEGGARVEITLPVRAGEEAARGEEQGPDRR